MHRSQRKRAKLDADFIVRDLYDFICEDLLVDDELSGQIDASMDTFTSEVRCLRFFFFAPCIWLQIYPGSTIYDVQMYM